MDFIKYYACVVRAASLHAAHGVLLILIIAAGVVTYLNPQVEVLAIYTDGKWPLSTFRKLVTNFAPTCLSIKLTGRGCA